MTLALLSLLARCGWSASPGEADADPPPDAGRPDALLLSGPRLRVWWDEGLNYGIGREHLLGAPDPGRAPLTLIEGRVNLRLDVDGGVFAGGQGLGDFEDNVVLRRLQISTAGETRLLFPLQHYFRFSLVENRFLLDDNYLAVRPGGLVDRIRIGQFRPPQSLENLTQSHNTVFMERAAPVQALAPSAKSGVEASGAVLGDRMHWSFGVFSLGSSADTGEQSDAVARLVGRLSGALLRDGALDRPRLLHLGLSTALVFSSGGDRYKARPESFLAPTVVDTGPLSVRFAEVLGLEAAYVDGPWTVQAEYLQSTTQPKGGGVRFFPGFYVFASRILTGESRPYSDARDAFAAVRPRRPVFPGWGPGAWELGLRVSYLGLDSDDVQGGVLTCLTVGVNWYLTHSVTVRANYVHAAAGGHGPQGNVDIFQARLGLAF